MTESRNAESGGVRRWDGEVAAANDLNEVRHWVVWGAGPPAEEVLPEHQPGNDLARKIAEQHDPRWAEAEDGWVVLVDADEDAVDERVHDDESVFGYAAYLIVADAAGSSPEVMRGTLRDDEAQRRPFDLGKRQ